MRFTVPLFARAGLSKAPKQIYLLPRQLGRWLYQIATEEKGPRLKVSWQLSDQILACRSTKTTLIFADEYPLGRNSVLFLPCFAEYLSDSHTTAVLSQVALIRSIMAESTSSRYPLLFLRGQTIEIFYFAAR